MNTKLFVIIGCCFITLFNSSGQNIPNWDFESWETRKLYDEPVSWNTGNQEAFLSNTETAFRSADAYSGMYCLRLESVITEEDTLFGYAACDANITGGDIEDTLRFMGGIPVSGTPDSVIGYFKYEIPVSDTGIVLISFKSNGNVISQNIFSLFGSQSSYMKMGWEMPTLGETPDTMLIAFATTNPNDPKSGGWIQIDSLCFDGIDDTIPNADFENWEEYSYLEPENWVTANLFSFLFGGDTIVTPTEDAHSGNYAMRIESAEVMIPGDDGFANSVVGFGIPYTTSFDFTESLPTFEVDFNPMLLTGYYKFEPLQDDTALVYIVLLNEEEEVVGEYGSFLYPVDHYVLFTLTLDYPEDITVTEVAFVVSTTIYFMQGDGVSGEIGSILYLDDLRLVSLCETLAPYEIASVELPTCDVNTAVIDAGEGWDEYLWSNSETTQTITVDITGEVNYSVTVTDNDTRCEFSDEVTIGLPTGCGSKVEEIQHQLSCVKVYPNPSSGMFTIDFHNIFPGEYTAEIIDITGKSLLRKKLNINRNSMKYYMDMTDYPEGLYLVKITGNNFSHCKRLLLE